MLVSLGYGIARPRISEKQQAGLIALSSAYFMMALLAEAREHARPGLRLRARHPREDFEGLRPVVPCVLKALRRAVELVDRHGADDGRFESGLM